MQASSAHGVTLFCFSVQIAGKVDELAGREQMGATPKALSYVSRSGAEVSSARTKCNALHEA